MRKEIENKKIPEELFYVIEKLLEKYALEESDDEWKEKRGKEIKTNGDILAFIIGRDAKERFSLDELSRLVKEKLMIETSKAEGIAKEIKRKITDKDKIQKKKEERINKDSYRESL